jgi:hypothetical protein
VGAVTAGIYFIRLGGFFYSTLVCGESRTRRPARRSDDIPEHSPTRSLRSAGQLATPQPSGKGHRCEPDEQPELQEDRAEEDAVSRSRQDGDQDAEERRRRKVDKSQSARPATQLGANRMQSVLHPRSIGATALRLEPTAGRRRLFGIGADHDSSGDISEH